MADDDLLIGSRAIAECVLCDYPTTRDDVISHLMEKHSHFDCALLISLWWFMDPEEEDA